MLSKGSVHSCHTGSSASSLFFAGVLALFHQSPVSDSGAPGTMSVPEKYNETFKTRGKYRSSGLDQVEKPICGQGKSEHKSDAEVTVEFMGLQRLEERK